MRPATSASAPFSIIAFSYFAISSNITQENQDCSPSEERRFNANPSPILRDALRPRTTLRLELLRLASDAGAPRSG